MLGNAETQPWSVILEWPKSCPPEIEVNVELGYEVSAGDQRLSLKGEGAENKTVHREELGMCCRPENTLGSPAGNAGIRLF